MNGFRNTKREYNLHKTVAKFDILRNNSHIESDVLPKLVYNSQESYNLGEWI